MDALLAFEIRVQDGVRGLEDTMPTERKGRRRRCMVEEARGISAGVAATMPTNPQPTLSRLGVND